MDEILRGFLEPLFARYREVAASDLGPRKTLEAYVIASFDAIDTQHSAVAIYQVEARHLRAQERFAYIDELNTEFRQLWHDVLAAGVADGSFRADLDIELAYRFLRDTVWVAVSWYRPGGSMTADTIAKHYLAIVLDGVATKET